MKKQQKEIEQKRRLASSLNGSREVQEAENVQKAKEKAEKAQERTGTKRTVNSGTRERAGQRTRRKKMLGDMDENMNTDVCCVCYGSYL